ncbi:beta-lactamase domain protein [Methanococcus vannielii SB]|jgi:glyoxylase-like metal-dependent hydrolase (beta-lactamase superfamily II)|uniref:Metallo-beta-lactamase domain-containing protein 1 n=1 Tax=Methanococcus vannielii (strain ATCC 35089 / DSM 1224 / JCM 13029 / OCM 148 / SB) TaxID=406327 RepID=A6USU3_METVS|nr:MBL fold metallo-hydrolase [Methanococcus vannielii]ABR55565.1 beta-lactamase domain protein [Methanococcus vannielii SB]
MIDLVYFGYLERSSEKILDVSSSVTYIETRHNKIVVDTSSKSKRNHLISYFNNKGVKLDEIDYVINTHFHFDHVSNNELFKNALIINFSNISKLNDPEIKIIPTPGHTSDSISVVYQDYIISGDASPLKNNILKELPPKVHTDFELALNSIKHIKSLGKNIITGHDGILYKDEY